jgi:hypothetical protein
VKTTHSQAVAVSYRPKRAALNWVDYLVIAATIMTFATVVAVNNPHAARAQAPSTVTQAPSTVISASELPIQTGQVGGDANLIKSKIGLATHAQMWGATVVSFYRLLFA